MEKSRIILIALVIFVLIVGVFVITYILGSLGEPQTQINTGSSSGSSNQNQGGFGSGSGSSGFGSTNNPTVNNPINNSNNQGGSTRPINRTTSLVSKRNYQFYDSSDPLYLNDSLTKRKTTIDSHDLPWVLADSVFRGAKTVSYEQKLVIGSFPKLIYGKQPSDNNTVTDAILLSYDPLTPSYYLRVIFDDEIDFTAGSSIGKSLLLFGKNFTVDEATDEESIVLVSNDTELILEDDGDIYLDDDKVDNVRVEFDRNFTETNQITFEMRAENKDKDAILKEGNFKDPLFGTFRVEYQGLNIEEASGERETIHVSPSNNPSRMKIEFRDHRTNQANFFWINGVSNLFSEPRLADENGNRIVTFEQAPIVEKGYVIVGGIDTGYILKLQTLDNQSSGTDRIIFKDITNDETYTVQIASEGKGTLAIGGQNYGVAYTNSSVRLDHPETTLENGIGKGLAFKTIKTSKGAKILFYQPTVMNFNTLANLYGNTPQKVNIFLPTYEGFMEVAFSVSTQNGQDGQWWTAAPSGAGLLNTNSNTSIRESSDGSITYAFVGEGATNRSTVYLKDKNGALIMNPAIVIFDEQTSFSSQNKKDILILKIRENPSYANPMIVEQVQLMHGSWIFSKLNNTGSLIEKSFNRYGTIYIKDGSNGKYVNTTISYPNNQVFGSVRIKEL